MRFNCSLSERRYVKFTQKKDEIEIFHLEKHNEGRVCWWCHFASGKLDVGTCWKWLECFENGH